MCKFCSCSGNVWPGFSCEPCHRNLEVWKKSWEEQQFLGFPVFEWRTKSYASGPALSKCIFYTAHVGNVKDRLSASETHNTPTPQHIRADVHIWFTMAVRYISRAKHTLYSVFLSNILNLQPSHKYYKHKIKRSNTVLNNMLFSNRLHE